MQLRRPDVGDIRNASRRISPYITRTPLHRYPSLERLLGAAQVHVKHENYQRLGAFKMRGGLNLISQMSSEERSMGVISASTGNHGQSIAFAAREFGASATIVVPEGANPGKVQAMQDLGATVVFHGDNFDDAREHVERVSREEGLRYIHSANEPALIEGVATYALEIMEDLPDVDTMFVPIGGGSAACGACIAAKGISPSVRVVGVQAEAAQAAYLSWKSGRLESAPMRTRAEGLATALGFEYTVGILRDLLDDFVLVSEEELDQAVALHLELTHDLAEHAGAASLAGALKRKDELEGRNVVLVLSGGNISMDHLRGALAAC